MGAGVWGGEGRGQTLASHEHHAQWGREKELATTERGLPQGPHIVQNKHREGALTCHTSSSSWPVRLGGRTRHPERAGSLNTKHLLNGKGCDERSRLHAGKANTNKCALCPMLQQLLQTEGTRAPCPPRGSSRNGSASNQSTPSAEREGHPLLGLSCSPGLAGR